MDTESAKAALVHPISSSEEIKRNSVNVNLDDLQDPRIQHIIEKLRDENARILANEREAMAQQIVQSLKASGVFNTQQITPKPPAVRPKKYPTALDKGLQNLLNHSLTEDGLTFPSLKTTSTTKAKSSDSKPARGRGEGPVLYMRTEEEIVCEKTRIVGQQEDIPQQEEPQVEGGYRRRKKKKRLERRGGNAMVIPQQSSAVTNDAGFKSLRGKFLLTNSECEIDNKTAVMLDKSRKLVGKIKKRQIISQKLPVNESPPDAVQDDYEEDFEEETIVVEAPEDPSFFFPDCEPPSSSNKPTDKESVESSSSVLEEEERSVVVVVTEDSQTILRPMTEVSRDSSTRASTSSNNEDDTRSYINSRGSNDDDENIISNDKDDGSSTNTLQVLLDNEDWENALAKQILTLYTSSEKAKKLKSQNPPSHNTTTTNTVKVKKKKTPHGKVLAPIKSTTKKNNRSTNSAWEASYKTDTGNVVINVPKVPKSIWFAGAGAVRAVWCSLARCNEKVSKRSKNTTSCGHHLCEQLLQLENSCGYKKYVALVDALITARFRANGLQQIDIRLWKQLVITTNAFVTRAIEAKKYMVALELLKSAEKFISNEVFIEEEERNELLCFAYDSYAYYYYARQKYNAGIRYAKSAYKIHAKNEEWNHVTKVLLHLSTLQSKLKDHKAALESLGKVLAMVEEEKLEEDTGSSAQKICMVAVCYHNVAIERLHLRDVKEASVASQNGRRLAKLCLSYSNRWYTQFESTHKTVLAAVAARHEDNNNVSANTAIE